MRALLRIALILLLASACKDSTAPSEPCRGSMADARRTWGEPFSTTASGDDAIRVEVWDFHDGNNVRRFRFRWGTLVGGCVVESEIIVP